MTCKKVCETTKKMSKHEGTPECLKKECENEGREYAPPPPKYWCESCNKEYKNEFVLAKHMLTAIHKRAVKRILHGPETYRCEKCDTSFTNNKGLTQHLKTKRPLAPKVDLFCSVCDKTYKNKKCWKQHLKYSKFHKRLSALLDKKIETALVGAKTALIKVV